MISVIMLTYNRARYVRYMIEDVLAQTYTDFEFVIVNNGSTDETGDILSEYVAKDSRISVVTISPEEAKKYACSGAGTNIGRARNIGLKASRGELIAFVDDDDRIQKDYLEFLYELMTENDADISMCGASQGDGTTRSPQCLFDEKMVISGEQAVDLLLGRKYLRAGMPTKLYKREILERHPFTEVYQNEDIHTQYKYLLECKKMAMHGIDKYYCVRNTNNISGFTSTGATWTKKTMSDYLAAYENRRDYIISKAPNLKHQAEYSVWSFMISMVEKVERFNIEECREIQANLKSVLYANKDEFMAMPEITDFEIDWMNQYVLNDTY